MSWSKSLETGIKDVDERNRALLEHVDTLMRTDDRRSVGEILDDLERLAIRHFEEEQALHVEAEYPKAAPHRRYHESYVVKFRRIKRKYIEEGATLSNLLAFNRNVAEWLERHILSHDKDFAEYYKTLAGR